MKMIIRGAVVALLVAGAVAAVRAVARVVVRAVAPWRAPLDSPAAFLEHGRRPGARAVVVCAGDSITHGVVSANYVGILSGSSSSDSVEFVNAGINGDLAWNVLQRLDAVIACRPDAVTLLVGTNDVLATVSPSWESSYRRQQHIPVTPTLAWYRENVRAIIDRLQAETDARLAILDLPPIGEDLESETNGRIRDYNAALRGIGAATGVEVLPLNDRLAALLPEGHTPPPFTGGRMLMGSAVARHVVLRRPWNDVSADHGMAILTDHLHLNDRAAAVVADLVEGWLAERQ